MGERFDFFLLVSNSKLIGAGTVNIRSRGSGPTDHKTVGCYFPIEGDLGSVTARA
jgi:hypothetical protein